MGARHWTITPTQLALLAATCGGVRVSGSATTIIETLTVDKGNEEVDAADVEYKPSGDTDEGADDAAAEAQAAPGTWDTPLTVRTRIQVGDSTLAVTGVRLDRMEQVTAENQCKDPPVDVRQFKVCSVDATDEGEDSGRFGSTSTGWWSAPPAPTSAPVHGRHPGMLRRGLNRHPFSDPARRDGRAHRGTRR